MAAHFDTVQPAGFDTVTFPVDRVEVVGGMRDHIHEYPHQDGGSPELLGRKLYVIRMHAIFDETIDPQRFPQYKGNYPEGLAALRSKFEKRTKADLTIPTLGTIRAYCRSWPQTWTAQVRSGETADFEFVEVPSELEFSVRIDLDSMAQLKTKLNLSYESIYGSPPKLPSLLDEINSAIDALIVMRDQGELIALQMEVAALKLEALVREADRTVKEFQRPFAWRTVEVMKDLWLSTIKLTQDIGQKSSPIQFYKVPRRMSVSEIAQAIPSVSTARPTAMDILQLNPVEDAFAVTAGTSIKYYGV